MQECHICGNRARAVYEWKILNTMTKRTREPLCPLCAAIMEELASTESFDRVEPLEQ